MIYQGVGWVTPLPYFSRPIFYFMQIKRSPDKKNLERKIPFFSSGTLSVGASLPFINHRTRARQSTNVNN